jgi:1-deoxy-D-xylulose-5-phosphate reductoisomerase
VAAHPDKFQVVALTAGSNLELLVQQIKLFSPRIVAVLNEELAQTLKGMLSGRQPEILAGVTGMIAAATADETDMVVAAIVGAAGLVPTAAAIKAGKDVALANKETLVTAGHLIMDMVVEHGVKLFPVDSEHSAVFQSIEGHRSEDITKLILTASGGPFRNTPLDKMATVTLADALNHPNWSMGKKITIDSATMMNKGLEVIEARWLFDVPPEKIDVNIHPQSIIHSMVEYVDGCVIAQLGMPDMKAPIAYALSYPERVSTGVKPLDLTEFSGLTFFKPDLHKFRCLQLAYDALSAGESMPAVMNAANEVAVEAFLNGLIGFLDIGRVIEQTMNVHQPHRLPSIDEVLHVDRWSREKTRELLGLKTA